MAPLFNQNFLTWSNPSINRGGDSVGGWVELGRTTLGETNDTVSVGSLADKRYYMVLGDIKPSGNVYTRTWLNADSGTNYSTRFSTNGAADSTITSTNDTVTNQSTDTTPYFTVQYFANLSSKEKLWMNWSAEQETAGTAPSRTESVNKWANTSNPISTIQQTNEAAGDLASGTELVVLGWYEADTHTTNFWKQLASVTAGGASTNISSGTITAKKYLWVQAWLESTSAHVTNMTFNNDTTTYAYRNSDDGGADDGGADVTSESDSHIEIAQSSSTALFTNMFIINNSANEKLVIGHTINQGTAGAGAAPNRREFVGKYDNTSSQITEIDLDSSSGNWSSNSIIKVWGSN